MSPLLMVLLALAALVLAVAWGQRSLFGFQPAAPAVAPLHATDTPSGVQGRAFRIRDAEPGSPAWRYFGSLTGFMGQGVN